MRPSTHTNANLQCRRGLQGFCDKNAHLKRARTQVSRRGTAAARFTNRNTFGRWILPASMRPFHHTNSNLQYRRGLQGFCDKNEHLKRARTQISRRGTAAARFTNRNTFGRWILPASMRPFYHTNSNLHCRRGLQGQSFASSRCSASPLTLLPLHAAT